MEEDYKQTNMKALIAYLSGKDEVYINDIKDNAGVDSLRLYPLIAELHTTGKLEILETEIMGSPKIVKLK